MHGFRGHKFKSSNIAICSEVAVSKVNAPSRVDEKAPREVGTSQSIESWLTLWRTQLQIRRDREEERRIGDVRHRHQEDLGRVGGIRLRRQV